jgi:hypothetical protein
MLRIAGNVDRKHAKRLVVYPKNDVFLPELQEMLPSNRLPM